MTIGHARVLKASQQKEAPRQASRFGAEPQARRISAAVLAAREEAERIVAAARAEAEAIADRARAEAATLARQEEEARLAAAFLALRAEDERRLERDTGRVVDLAVLLAERLIGEALRVEPARIAELAATAIAETRGARRVRVAAAPGDVVVLREALGAAGVAAEITEDPALGRGSVIVHTELGQVDARLEPQLARLAAALREALG
jgi:flagellar assembly protein FliH/type III secretion protein L